MTDEPKSIARKVLDVIDRAVNGLGQDDPQKAEAAAAAKARGEFLETWPFPPKDSFPAIAKKIGFEVAEEIRLAISSLQVDWDNDQAEIAAYARAATGAYRHHRQDLLDKIALGLDLREVDHWSADELRTECLAKMSLHKERIKQHSIAAFEILKPIFEDYAVRAEELADNIEETERQQYAELSVPYAPSAIVNTIRKAALVVRNTPRSYSKHSGLAPTRIADIIL